MPGTKAKAAQALRRNVAFLVEEFGINFVGFLTLTVGDWKCCRPYIDRSGRFRCRTFVPVCDRPEAEKRFHRAMRSIAARYQCGCTVTERMESRAIHWHLVVVLGGDIRTGIDFEAIERRDYRSAPPRLKLEWKWWRENAARYGLGRHELLPVKVNADSIGEYVGKYIGKGWAERTADDKGARTVRYFGHWGNCPIPIDKDTGKPMPWRPPFSLRFCACTARAGAWREFFKQLQRITRYHGLELHQDNIKGWWGRRWAWHITKRIRLIQFFNDLPRVHPLFNEGITRHNEEAGPVHHLANIPLQNWLPTCELTEGHRAERDWEQTMNRQLPMPEFDSWPHPG